MAGADQRRGALDHQAGTGGGPQPGGEASPRTRSPKLPSRKRSPKSLPDKRVHTISVRLNDDEKRLLAAAAKQTRTSLPAFLARAGLAAARDAENTAAVIAGQRELVAELFAARRNLGWAGSNLNQITKALNSGGQPEQLDAVLDSVRRAAHRVQDAADKLLDRA
ncbi:plasmid mobilization protein [Streptomyces bathyalis]|uniref:plasmid mobilization protein n=1 Tax=Streptomyces bathyalis TaxID=2710756 RepID=UPI001FE9F7D1|nr:plasmid mobilization relaxosome protein MobC [Streptomyces bathyalis]